MYNVVISPIFHGGTHEKSLVNDIQKWSTLIFIKLAVSGFKVVKYGRQPKLLNMWQDLATNENDIFFSNILKLQFQLENVSSY